MSYSNICLKVVTAVHLNIIKSNNSFWKDFYPIEKFEENLEQNDNFYSEMNMVRSMLNSLSELEGVICAFDDDFPVINSCVTNKSEKPYLLFYKGNIDLLSDLNKNVSVIGLTNPTEEIESRERVIVNKLVSNGMVIVSGLANGCDEISHRVCVENKAPTIAILPSTINEILPVKNRKLAEEIVKNNGLLLTEYFKEPKNKYDLISRYVQRDRLQALFAKAVILIASYRQNEGDSGSRHAMSYAMNYKINRYLMFDEKKDLDNVQFGLNLDLLSKNDGAVVLTPRVIESIVEINNDNLTKKSVENENVRYSLLDD